MVSLFTFQDANGLVDFRDVALALAALDGGRDLEELTLLAFEVLRCGVKGVIQWLCSPHLEACVRYAVTVASR